MTRLSKIFHLLQVWPDVSGCTGLTTLKLRDMAPYDKPSHSFEGFARLRNVQITYCYMGYLSNRTVPLEYVSLLLDIV